MRHAVAIVLVAFMSSPVVAGPADDPRCAVDLQRAWKLVNAVAGRDKGGPYAKGAICGVLRANLRDMKESTAIMRRCMTGHALRENVGQMEASMEDVAAVIANRCR